DVLFFFFFSSRRRHTRFSRDWSSDVCSSDLVPGSRRGGRGPVVNAGWASVDAGARVLRGEGVVAPEVTAPRRTICPLWIYKLWEIGRASCRERGESAVGAEAVKETARRRGCM